MCRNDTNVTIWQANSHCNMPETTFEQTHEPEHMSELTADSMRPHEAETDADASARKTTEVACKPLRQTVALLNRQI